MPRWLYGLLLLFPAALIARFLALSNVLVFVLSAGSVVPLAALIGKATEELAYHIGPRYGGLLNATFGNTVELIILGLALRQGLLTLVKASITGSIIGNTLLVLGTALLVGGIKNGRQQFDPRRTSVNAVLMILAVAGLYLPAIFATTVKESTRIEELSLFVAGVLLVTYGAFLVYMVLQNQPAKAGAAKDVMTSAEEAAGEEARDDEHTAERWSIGKALLALAGAVIVIAISAELLVNTIDTITARLGWSELFLGVIFIPTIGNAAEYFTAVRMAWHNRLDVTLPIAAGSSAQVALLMGPLLVFLSVLLGHPLNLIFTRLELAVLGLAVASFAYISLDGKANWLEGFQLIALYLLAGLAFFFLPFAQP
jgi:Ca2+:H+ antiporter